MDSTTVSKVELQELHSTDDSEGGISLGERLDLVEHLSVRLQVTLGKIDMSIAKLFALKTGEVVSLDREVDAPVDIELNGKTVGRGHLVAVGDHFGVRITEINTD